jgi:glycerol-3-phosphate dehydrogenase
MNKEIYKNLIDAEIPLDRIEKAKNEGSIKLLEEEIKILDFKSNFSSHDIGVIGSGDFAVALAKSFKKHVRVLMYDINELKSIFSKITRITTNRSFLEYYDENIDFTLDLEKLLSLKYLALCVPASAIPEVLDNIKSIIPISYKEKKYILLSKGFIGRGYFPHRWLQKNGVPFENIIWASGGNVARDVLEKKSLNISVVSINKSRRDRKYFSNLLNPKFLKPIEYSGSALVASELGGILKNYYAGLGRYIYIKYGENALEKYKDFVIKEFRRAARFISSAPPISIRSWVIRKASIGPAFIEDLDVTIKDGRNGLFGDAIFNKGNVLEALEDIGLVESFSTVFSTLSLFNRLRDKKIKKLPVLKFILETYEAIHIEYLNRGDAHIREETIESLKKIEEIFK